MLRSVTPQHNRVSSNTQSSIENSYRESNDGVGSLRRKGSFSFLRRSRSRERAVSAGSLPQRKLSKKERSKIREQEMMQERIPSGPPRIPLVPHASEMPTFGGGEDRPDSVAIMSNRAGGSFQNRLAQKTSQETIGSNSYYRGMPVGVPPVPPLPPLPGQTPKSAYVDAFPRSESMTHRGRYSYASSAISTVNSPRKIRRRKDPTPFNILVIGARHSGKTSFLNFLESSLALPAWKLRQQSRDDEFDIPQSTLSGSFPNYTSHYVETEIDTERIGVTLWDSTGLENNMVDLQLKEITTFIESKFEETFTEESKVARAPGFRDTHIHCVLLVLDPARLDANIAAAQIANAINGVKAKANSFHQSKPERFPNGLDENLDLNVLRALKGKTTVVPIISKADTITSTHMAHLKRAVWDSLKTNNLETFEALEQPEDDDESETLPNSTKFDERDEDSLNKTTNNTTINEEDKFSVTSVLNSPSGSDSTFSASDFDLAKPPRASKLLPERAASSHGRPSSMAAENSTLPLSIISPDPFEPGVVGRKFPWGFADPYNAEHCDFTKLKEMVFTEWRGDLREASRELWYEGWRTSRLNKKMRRNGTISLAVNDTINNAWAHGR